MSSILRKPWFPWLLTAVAGVLLIATLVTAASALSIQVRTHAALNPETPRNAALPRTDESAESDTAENNGNDGRGRRGRDGGRRDQPQLADSFGKLLDEKAFFGKKTRNPQLQSVIGEYAIIDGQWIKQGEEQNGVKVLEIAGDKVKIEFDGTQREMKLFQDMPGIPEPRPRETPPPVVASADTPTSGSPPSAPSGDEPAPAAAPDSNSMGASAVIDVQRETPLEGQRDLIRQRMELQKRESNQ